MLYVCLNLGVNVACLPLASEHCTSPPLLSLESAQWPLPDASTSQSPSLVVCGRSQSASKSEPFGYCTRCPAWQRSSRVPPAAGARDRAHHVRHAALLP